MLIWRLILKEYGTCIEYIKGENNIEADALSIFLLNRNQATPKKSTHQKEIVSEINDNEEIREGRFPINLKLINQHQRKDSILMDKYKEGMHHKGLFFGGSNIDLNLKTYKDKINISSIFQNYILHWYHMYILHPGLDRMEMITCKNEYWPGNRYAIRKEVTNCDTCQHTK